jgi:hypothetical protein
MLSQDYLNADPLFQRAKAQGQRCRQIPIVDLAVANRGTLRGHILAAAIGAALGILLFLVMQ